MKQLLAPLQRIANLIEDQNEKINEIHSVLTVDLKKASKETHAELEKHTALLLDIRGLLKSQLDETRANAGGKNSGKEIKMPKIGGWLSTGVGIVIMAGAIVASAALLQFMPVVAGSQMVTAIAIGALMLLLTPVYISIVESFRRSSARIIVDKITGNSFGAGFSSILQLAGTAGLSMLTMAAGIVLSAWVLIMLPTKSITLAQFGNALLTGIIMIPLSYAIAGFLRGLRAARIKMNKKGVEQLGLTSIAMAAVALGLTATAWIFKLLPSTFKSPPLAWTIGVSVLFFAFGWALPNIVRAVKKLGGGMRGMKNAALLTLIIPIIALALVGAAWIFTLLPGEQDFKAPPIKWALQTALVIGIFSVAWLLLTTIGRVHKRSLKELSMTAVGLAFVALSIMAVAWIFTWLPDPGEMIAPTQDWSIAVAISLAIFAIPFLVVGLIGKAIGPMGLLYGALGMILIAGTMFVVAWIFSAMPDLSAISKNFTDAIMYPVNAMIDALNRFKDEIGIDNMGGLALGIMQIAGAWLVLVAALAGQSGGGLLATGMDFISGGIGALGSALGISEKAKTPIQVLDQLINRASGLRTLADPLNQVADAYVRIKNNQDAVVKGLSSVVSELAPAIFGALGSSADTFANAFGEIADHSRRLDIKAIDATTKMFNAIAKVAEADGEDAITVLARELMVAVKELSETVENMEEVMEAQQRGMGDIISGALSTFKEKIFGANKAAGKGGEEESVNMQDVVLAIEALQDRFNYAIPVKNLSS
jgi:hypothetical protein